MSMILKSYDEGKLALEDWTDDMLAPLPGWSGWQYCDYNCEVYWYIAKSSFTNHCVGSYVAGDVIIHWSPDYGCQFARKILANDAANLPLIAGKPFIKLDDGYYYIKGNNYRGGNNLGDLYDIARCTSIPGV